MPVPEDANHLGPHEMRRQKHRAKTPIWARPDRACPGLRDTSRRVQLKGSAHEATTFWSTTGEMGTRLMEPTGEQRIDIVQRQAKGLDISDNMALSH